MRLDRSAPAALLLALASCAVYAPEPLPEDAGGDPAVLAELREGRSLYVAKCSGCHSLHAVEEFGDRDWRASVQEMIDLKKVRLLDQQRLRLERYLTTLNRRD